MFARVPRHDGVHDVRSGFRHPDEIAGLQRRQPRHADEGEARLRGHSTLLRREAIWRERGRLHEPVVVVEASRSDNGGDPFRA